LDNNFGLVAAEPSFLELPVSEVASFVASDDLEASEEVVFEAVLAWVKGDEATRKTELDRLLPLVRFPLMQER
jgi:kelch-like protein 24/35